MYKKFGWLVILVGCCIQTLGQAAPDPLFTRLTKKDGLASNVIFQTIQDRQGFIWIGTQHGLHRFDGRHLLQFHHIPGDSSSLADNGVIRLYIDKKERLWTVFGNRLGFFNTTTFKFRETPVPTRINIVKKILEDEQGHLFIVTDQSGLLQFNEKKNDFSDAYPLPPLPAGYKLDNITPDAGPGKYWITTREGLLYWHQPTKQISSPDSNLLGNATLAAFSGIKNTRYPFLAKDGSLWLVDWVPFRSTPVLYRYDRVQQKMHDFNAGPQKLTDVYHEIWGVRQQQDGTIWIYGNGLLASYDEGTNHFTPVKSKPYAENAIEFDFISDVFEDRERNVWVSSNKGLYRFNKELRFFSNIPNKGLHDTAADTKTITAILPTKSNGIWVSSFGGGIKSYDEKWKPIANPFTNSHPQNKSLVVVSMMQRKNGEIWIGLQSGTIKIYNPANNSTQDFRHSLLEGGAVRQILEDKNGDVWIASYNSNLVKCRSGNWKDSTRMLKVIESEISVILKLYEDRQGFIWVGTTLDGVYKIDPKTDKAVRHYVQSVAGKNDGLFETGCTDILQYNDSTMLMLSNSICMLNLKTDKFRYITRADGLPPENGISMTVDSHKWIWVALAGGLYRYNFDRNIMVPYDQSNGIMNSDFEVAAGTMLNDGRIALGTSHDFLVFDPLSITDTKAVPKILITGVNRAGNALTIDTTWKTGYISLPYENSALTIEYSTLSFRNKYKYLYMLEGVDREWKSTTDMQMVYPYLPPGDYVFLVKAVNSEGIVGTQATSLAIHVTTPFWRSWWFYSLLGLAAVAILYWLDRRRIKRREFIHQMRSSIAGSLHQEVNTTLHNINILSEVARIKADQDIEESKQYIQQIHSKSQHMIVAMNDMLWSIDPANDNMQRLVNRIQEYIDGLNNRYDIRIELSVDEKVLNAQLNMQSRYQTMHIIKECIDVSPIPADKRFKVDLGLDKETVCFSLSFKAASADLEPLRVLMESDAMRDRLGIVQGEWAIDTNKSSSLFMLRIPAKA